MNVVNTPFKAILDVQAEAQEELAKERATAAKGKIKESLKKIAAAEKVLQNVRDEHAVLLRDLSV